MGQITAPIIIRDAREEDREQIQKLVVEAYSQYEATMAPERWRLYLESIKESVYKEGPYARIIAEQAGDIVGSLLVFLDSETAYGRDDLSIQDPIIRLLATSPQVRGQGVATRLIDETAARARSMGAEYIYLHTSDMMAPAIRLYEHLGFERAREQEMYNGDVLVKCYRLAVNPAAEQTGHSELRFSSSQAGGLSSS
ncbi:GNAT family N-acetyltransferase [Paenibacillus tuaregi]|uniref:GNAT family N-acetyltransferase n=1 Tax=Paenibacillus tuaregi TaxID=1816681 RepID=UPI0009EE494C|nr:GNAT family N-acetyltransferase [Paenibacillus tuaregi]